MNTIQINADGMVTISQETAEERIAMAQHYASQERSRGGEEVYDETAFDEVREQMFKSGWNAAVTESQLWYVNGRIEEFYNTAGIQGPANGETIPQESADPHHNEPEGTGEGVDATEAMYAEDPDFEANWGGAPEETMSTGDWSGTVDAFKEGMDSIIERDPDIRPVQNEFFYPSSASTADPHGDPSTKEQPGDVESGTWTMSNEELQSRLDASYSRGYDAASGRQVTRRTLLKKAQEVVANDTLKIFANGQASPTPFHEAFGDSVEAFVVPLAKALGFKVVD